MKKKFGATRQFPRGKFSSDDEGELKMGVTMKDKTVIIDFGTPVVWLGLDRQGALTLADLIRKYAESIT